MIVQIFRETRPTAATNILQDNIDQIDNDNTLRSMFSGDSFPTNPAPVVGQPCYRTDLKKLFVYTADGWVEIMGKPIYDPRSVSADVFHMDNMTEGINTKIMTSAERDKLANATVGPANSIDGGIAVFDGTTGKAIKDSGINIASITEGAFGNHSFAANGYQVFPGGLIIQWGVNSAPANAISGLINFPIAFPHAALIIVASTPNAHHDAIDDASVGALINSRFNFRVFSNDSSKKVHWIAIGY